MKKKNLARRDRKHEENLEEGGGAPSLNRAQIMQQTYHGNMPLMHLECGSSLGNVLVWKSEVEATLNIEGPIED
ncbi:Protein CBG27844 [Caenorhabditis briggsae]|uniref:Protein CBG27844 n=1 Tax=Caenorhabditis briggsae TaxID=6238 RepID=B6IKC6_CAEBR|nr:Protein CBG27844 [Caenorhabditis briggsae]CAS00356.1 Protein CBG27844 [Caenorhabditis briggsae]